MELRLKHNLIESAGDYSLPVRVRALDEFASLLKENPRELRWQRFFDENPFILTETIPLRIDSLYSHVKLNSGIPDYVFHSGFSSPLFSTSGVIELKRPDHSIVSIYGNHVNPSSELTKAFTQTKDYIADLDTNHRIVNKATTMAIGNNKMVFIIIGMSDEVTRKCYEEVYRLGFARLLPPGFVILPYDDLFNQFRRSMPKSVCFLVAYEPDLSSTLHGLSGTLVSNGFHPIDVRDNTLQCTLSGRCSVSINDSQFIFENAWSWPNYDSTEEVREVLKFTQSKARFTSEHTITGNLQYAGDDQRRYADVITLPGELFDFEWTGERLLVSCSHSLINRLIVNETRTDQPGKNMKGYSKKYLSKDFNAVSFKEVSERQPSLLIYELMHSLK